MSVVGKAKDVAEDVGEKAKDLAETISDRVSDVAGPTWDKLRDVAESVGDRVSDVALRTMSAMQDAGPAWDSLKLTASSVKEVAETVADRVSGAAADVKDKVFRSHSDLTPAPAEATESAMKAGVNVAEYVATASDSFADNASADGRQPATDR
jgi:hypothetical protein